MPRRGPTGYVWAVADGGVSLVRATTVWWDRCSTGAMGHELDFRPLGQKKDLRRADYARARNAPAQTGRWTMLLAARSRIRGASPAACELHGEGAVLVAQQVGCRPAVERGPVVDLLLAAEDRVLHQLVVVERDRRPIRAVLAGAEGEVRAQVVQRLRQILGHVPVCAPEVVAGGWRARRGQLAPAPMLAEPDAARRTACCMAPRAYMIWDLK
jgi:hypothetical protein